VIATDVRADYLAALALRARRAGLSNLVTRPAEPERPGLDDASVDLVILCQVDHYLADRARYFAALARALRPGGRIAIANYVRFRDADLAAARAAGLRPIDAWSPSPPFFLLVVAPAARR
jgi:SAM-dependent methyltransferase